MNKFRDHIIDLVPAPVVLALASPYLAGTGSATAIEFAHRQYRQTRLTSTLDILGESSTCGEQCDQATAKYLQLIDEIHARPLPVTAQLQQISISLKPSTFSAASPDAANSVQPQLDDAYARIESIVEHACKRGVNITIEAEDHYWTDFHLSTYFSLIQKGYNNLGTVLQSRLLRTEQDIKKFAPKMRVRLVIGIYDEPQVLALTDKQAMKQRLVEYGLHLAQQGTYVEFATHDAGFIHQFIQRAVIPLHLIKSQFEFQFLKGVPRKRLQTELITGVYFSKLQDRTPHASEAVQSHLSVLADSGTTVRLYVPFGPAKSAGAYCKRRLKENPAIFVYGLKNLLHLQ